MAPHCIENTDVEAFCHEFCGHAVGAVELLERLFKIKVSMLAKDNPDRLASQHALSRAYGANGFIESLTTGP
jgi:hypothetical protein